MEHQRPRHGHVLKNRKVHISRLHSLQKAGRNPAQQTQVLPASAILLKHRRKLLTNPKATEYPEEEFKEQNSIYYDEEEEDKGFKEHTRDKYDKKGRSAAPPPGMYHPKLVEK